MKKRGRRETSVFLSKKAQVTVFIIIGLILLFSAGVLFYVKERGIPSIDLVNPDKSTPVEEFVKACVVKTATDGITVMGSQGGYIELPEDIYYNPTHFVSLIPGIGLHSAPKVPYWYYEAKTQYPSLGDMQKDINNFVQSNIYNCLNDFVGFKDEFEIVEKGLPIVQTLLTEGDVTITVFWDLDVRETGSFDYVNYQKFEVDIPVKLKRIWELATQIMHAENEDTFFEELTIDYMALHPADEIPFTGINFNCDRLVWTLPEIKEQLQDELAVLLTGVRFQKTNYPPFKADEKVYEGFKGLTQQDIFEKGIALPGKAPADAFMYFHAFFNVSDNSYKELTVGATYKQPWGMKVVATPNQNGIMKSGSQSLKSEFLKFMCLQTYHFVYDVTYPVMISISDSNAFNQRGFTFRFAFPVQIYHNEPKRSMLPVQVREPELYLDDICDNMNSKTKVAVTVNDAVYFNEVNKVNLSYECFIMDCDLGKTKPQGGKYQWKGYLPEGCSRGIVVANKPGYLESRQQIMTDKLEMYMYPLVNLSFDVKKHSTTSIKLGSNGGGSNMAPNEYAIIQLQSTDPEFSVFEKFAPVHKKTTCTLDGCTSEETNKTIVPSIELPNADVVYDLSIFLIRSSSNKDEIIGGWEGQWGVRVADVKDATQVTFPVVEQFPHPKSPEQLIEMWEVLSNKTKNYPNLVPVFG